MALVAAVAGGWLLLPLLQVLLVNAAAVEVARAGFPKEIGVPHVGSDGDSDSPALARAARYLALADRLAPGAPGVDRLQAYVEQRQGRVGQAILHAESAWLHSGRDKSTGWQLGRLHLAAGDEVRAVTTWREAGVGPTVLAHASHFAAAEQLDDATRWYALATSVDPSVEEAVLGYASVLARQGDLAAAEAQYEAALARFPRSPEPYAGLAQLLFKRRGDTRRAALVLERCLDVSTHASLCRFVLASVYVEEGRQREALEQLEIAAPLLPRNGDLWYELGHLYAAEGRCTEAVSAYLHAEQFGDHLVWRWLAPAHVGRVLRTMGREAGAIEAFQRAISAGRRFGAAQSQLTDLQDELNRPALGGKDESRSAGIQCQR